MKKLILGTAGHIDHGKTALVQALTGVDTDRLPEEKQRGITIDLGFANLQLGDASFGVVDVPGHEGFIRNMLAGATGMDAVLLVVAADEGVMPQTREHLAILDLLDVRAGVVAITKRDLVSEEWLQLVADDVRATLASTTLAHAPVVAVSARTGEGLDVLRTALVEQATQPFQRKRTDIFRMPIDRVFSVRGTGTVVTGTVWSGELRVEDAVHLLPGALTGRARGIQVHGAAAEIAVAGERAAVALGGVERAAIERGHVLAGEPWDAASMVTARIRIIEGTDWLLRMRQRVRVHLGTAEVLARAVLLDASALEPGSAGWVQLRLEAPLVARVGDRLVLRSYSPVTTIGGGTVAELGGVKKTRLGEADAAVLATILSGSAGEAIRAVLDRRGNSGSASGELTLHTPHTPPQIAQALRDLEDDVVIIGDHVFSRNVVESSVAAVIAAADALHAEQPLRPALDRAELRARLRRLPPALVERALELAVERGQLTATGSSIARAGFAPKLTARQESLRAAVLDALKTAELAAPTVGELARTLGEAAQIASLLRLLESEGLVRAIAPDVYVETGALQAAEARTRHELGGAAGLGAADFRATLPVSRKHLIPLLEYFDRIGLTHRSGDVRSVQIASGNDLRGTG